MRLLLDTHAFLWWVTDNKRLSQAARRAIADDGNDVFVSATTAWEIAIKHGLGKLPEADALVTDIAGTMGRQGFEELPITISDAMRAGMLPGLHGDPLTGCSSRRPCHGTLWSFPTSPFLIGMGCDGFGRRGRPRHPHLNLPPSRGKR